MNQKFPSNERLKSRKAIDALFLSGNVVKNFPFRLVYHELEELPVNIQIGFSVPKRSFKKAVDRNRIKRQLRELYRLNIGTHRDKLKKPLQMMLIYTAKEELKYAELEIKFTGLLERLVTELAKTT